MLLAGDRHRPMACPRSVPCCSLCAPERGRWLASRLVKGCRKVGVLGVGGWRLWGHQGRPEVSPFLCLSVVRREPRFPQVRVWPCAGTSGPDQGPRLGSGTRRAPFFFSFNRSPADISGMLVSGGQHRDSTTFSIAWRSPPPVRSPSVTTASPQDYRFCPLCCACHPQTYFMI